MKCNTPLMFKKAPQNIVQVHETSRIQPAASGHTFIKTDFQITIKISLHVQP